MVALECDSLAWLCAGVKQGYEPESGCKTAAGEVEHIEAPPFLPPTRPSPVCSSLLSVSLF